MLWPLDPFQFKVSADQYYETISAIMEVTCFFEVDHCLDSGFQLDRTLNLG